MKQLINNLLNNLITVKDLTIDELYSLKTYLIIICKSAQPLEIVALKVEVINEIKLREPKIIEIEEK